MSKHIKMDRLFPALGLLKAGDRILYPNPTCPSSFAYGTLAEEVVAIHRPGPGVRQLELRTLPEDPRPWPHVVAQAITAAGSLGEDSVTRSAGALGHGQVMHGLAQEVPPWHCFSCGAEFGRPVEVRDRDAGNRAAEAHRQSTDRRFSSVYEREADPAAGDGQVLEWIACSECGSDDIEDRREPGAAGHEEYLEECARVEAGDMLEQLGVAVGWREVVKWLRAVSPGGRKRRPAQVTT